MNERCGEDKAFALCDGSVRGVLGGRQTIHTVKINQVENGFIIEVGCKTFIATTWAEATICLAEYFENPAAAEKKYCRK